MWLRECASLGQIKLRDSGISGEFISGYEEFLGRIVTTSLQISGMCVGSGVGSDVSDYASDVVDYVVLWVMVWLINTARGQTGG